MKHSLDIVGQDSSSASAAPEVLRVGESRVVVHTAGAGMAARRFAAAMIDAGAVRIEDDTDPSGEEQTVRIVIRSSRGARTADEEAMEADANFVLGGARPAFAKRLVEELQRAPQS